MLCAFGHGYASCHKGDMDQLSRRIRPDCAGYGSSNITRECPMCRCGSVGHIA